MISCLQRRKKVLGGCAQQRASSPAVIAPWSYWQKNKLGHSIVQLHHIHNFVAFSSLFLPFNHHQRILCLTTRATVCSRSRSLATTSLVQACVSCQRLTQPPQEQQQTGAAAQASKSLDMLSRFDLILRNILLVLCASFLRVGSAHCVLHYSLNCICDVTCFARSDDSRAGCSPTLRLPLNKHLALQLCAKCFLFHVIVHVLTVAFSSGNRRQRARRAGDDDAATCGICPIICSMLPSAL